MCGTLMMYGILSKYVKIDFGVGGNLAVQKNVVGMREDGLGVVIVVLRWRRWIDRKK